MTRRAEAAQIRHDRRLIGASFEKVVPHARGRLIKDGCLKYLVSLLLLLLLAPSVQAQADTVTWTVVPGFNGTFKNGAWIPVTITVANNGNDVRGRLEWRWQGAGTRFAQIVELPRGANKRLVLPVVAESFGGDATLTLYDGPRTVIKQERVRFNQVDLNSLVVGVLSEASNPLAELADMPSLMGSGTHLVRLDSETLPDRWELLQSLDMLFVHDIDSSAWSAEQRGAIASWVADGGQLVVGGDRAETVEGLDAILPGGAGDIARDLPLRALADGTNWRLRDPAATVRALALTPRGDARVLAAGPGGEPLLLRRAHGDGQVVQAAFNLQALSTQGDVVRLWETVLPQSGAQPLWAQLRSNGQWVLQQSLALPALRLPSVWSVFGFLALYVALVGPLNYLLLRRFDRREWAYITVPLTAVLFTLAAYGLGAAGRGGSASATALTVVRAASGSTSGQGLSYVGLFSPVRRAYDIGLGPETLAGNAAPIFGGPREALEVVRTEAAVDLPGFLVDVGAMRPLMAERALQVPEVQLTVTFAAGDSAVATIENRSSVPLEDVALLSGDHAQKLDDFRPGERREVELERNGFVPELPFRAGGVIRRSDALNALRNSFFVPPAMMEPPGRDGVAIAQPVPAQNVTLIAWATQPSIDLRLDGSPFDVQGDTLYMWSVRETR